LKKAKKDGCRICFVGGGDGTDISILLQSECEKTVLNQKSIGFVPRWFPGLLTN
jgi:hypothetical protein